MDGIGTALGVHLLDIGNPHAVTAAQAGAIEDAADTVLDSHINWGEAADQVSSADVPYDHTASGLAATEVKSAIDEVAFGKVRDLGGLGYDFIRFSGVPDVGDRFTVLFPPLVTPVSVGFDDPTANVNVARVPGDVSATLQNAVNAINLMSETPGAEQSPVVQKSSTCTVDHGVLFFVSKVVNTNFDLAIAINVGGKMFLNAASAMNKKAVSQRKLYTNAHIITAQDILALAAGDGIVIGGIPDTYSGGLAPEVFSLYAQSGAGIIIPINAYALTGIRPFTKNFAFELADPLASANLIAGDVVYIKALI
jgi:hypothetical protein